ncbi:MAG TPA: DUF5995 family protein [Nocardioides sp.]|uniref:DUF5995 family protein n=1 Tax=Nocardioides sp. TaxID=35761 RepID=UPI002BFF504F|nr:DUF5995 family protein [Nocardioides sp.]HQR27233.1 DUF5995 family protein [Nocardioides sp.]
MADRTVDDVLAHLRRIDAELPAGDGAGVFNRMYLTVTEAVATSLAAGRVFDDPAYMADLDVAFASSWTQAYDAPLGSVPRAWAPLFEQRGDRSVLPIQFALAGMNAHIGHDLPLAVVDTCRRREVSPAEVHADYERVNDLLAACESDVRRSFLGEAGRAADAHVGAVVHLVSAWNIDRAREVAWVNVEALWELRRIGPLADRYRAALARTVGMASRTLLTPVGT